MRNHWVRTALHFPAELDFQYLHEQAVCSRGHAVLQLTRAAPGTAIVPDQTKSRYVNAAWLFTVTGIDSAL